MINTNISQLDGRQAIQNASDNPNNANGIENNAKPTFNNAVEIFKTNTAKSMSDIKETHYRAISEGTRELSAGKAIWQRIKNIAHNIKAFISSPMTSALKIGHDAGALVKTMNTEDGRKQLTETFLAKPGDADAMPKELTKQQNDILELKVRGNHNGNCGKVLDCAVDYLSLAIKVVNQCREIAEKAAKENELLQKDMETYDQHTKLKSFLDATLETFQETHDSLSNAFQNDPYATLEKTKSILKAVTTTFALYNTGIDSHKDDLEALKENTVANGIREKIHTVSKEISDIVGKFEQNLKESLPKQL